jgi:hypothetical protein
MMKRLGRITASVALVTGLSVGAALAQAPLGLSINPTQGIRGDVVNAQVNTDDIAANCATTAGEVQAAFQDSYNFLVFDALPIYYPQFPDPADNYEQLAFLYITVIDAAITFNIFGAAETALENSHVLTFADLVTQEPQGQVSTFDQTTGMGSVVVPDITPGVWAVAAACVAPDGALQPGGGAAADELIEKAIDVVAPILEADGRSLTFMLNDETLEYLNDHAVQFLQPLVTPVALGVQLFTIQTPTLGFTIDPTQGFPGDTVNGQVDTDDIDQYCPDQAEFLAQFQALFQGPFVGGDTVGELTQMFFPDPNNIVYENVDQMSYLLTFAVVFGVAFDFNGATADAFEQSFVMAFIDLLTQAPLGELGQFDPMTGMGSVVVPDLAPGPYPVAATCVLPTLDIDALADGIRAGGDFLESIGIQFGPEGTNSPEFMAWAQDFLGSDATGFELTIELVTAIGPDLLQPIVIPRALGLQFYTILSDVNHYQCYRARTTGFTSMPITLADRFGTRSVTVRKPVDLCAPADKNGEDPEAADSPYFLTSYKISGSEPFTQIAPVHAENQFGPIALKLKAPKTILVPTGVSLNGPPSSAAGAFLNDFTCYKARAVSPPNTPTPGVITLQTAFETVQVQPKKPKRLCVPAHKNGGPILAAEHENLLCYKAKSSGRLPAPAPVVFLANQFGDQTQRLGSRREVCIPTDLLE